MWCSGNFTDYSDQLTEDCTRRTGSMVSGLRFAVCGLRRYGIPKIPVG